MRKQNCKRACGTADATNMALDRTRAGVRLHDALAEPGSGDRPDINSASWQSWVMKSMPPASLARQKFLKKPTEALRCRRLRPRASMYAN